MTVILINHFFLFSWWIYLLLGSWLVLVNIIYTEMSMRMPNIVLLLL